MTSGVASPVVSLADSLPADYLASRTDSLAAGCSASRTDFLGYGFSYWLYYMTAITDVHSFPRLLALYP